MGDAQTEDLPASITRTLPRKIPIVLLDRLAVFTSAQGKGLHGLLLVDALKRTVRVSTQVGIAAILLDAKNAQTEVLNQPFGFQPLPGSPNKRGLPVKTAAGRIGA